MRILRTVFFLIVLMANSLFFAMQRSALHHEEGPVISSSNDERTELGAGSPRTDEYVGSTTNEVTRPVLDLETLSLLGQAKEGHAYANPAGCATDVPSNLSSEEMLERVQAQLPADITLAERRQMYIWNGPLKTMLNVSNDPFAYEFVFNSYAPPLTYRGDEVATIFLVNGFTIWFREYGGEFHLLAIPMVPGVLESPWADYVTAYWQPGGQPDDETIYPVMKKLPCHWVIEAGYVTDETIQIMFPLDWSVPDFLADGQQYLAQDCHEANRISLEKVGYWSATSMCGPLAWTIIKDVNGFPYRMGSWYGSYAAFEGANPRWNAQPWSSFDPTTFDLFHMDLPMAGYDFSRWGDLYTGDIVYSFSTLYNIPGDQHFDHIFLVAGIGSEGSRLSITNMVQNYPVKDCSISEVTLYTPGDRLTGVVNHEWNGFGFGKTGGTGFDIFRWKWITYHINGQAIPYTVRWGDTIETIAFDWKIDPWSIVDVNPIDWSGPLTPGQIIELPAPPPDPALSSVQVAYQIDP
jgi:hypothetical protein